MNATKRARVEAQRKDQVLRVLVAARKRFGEGGWCDRLAVSRGSFGTQNVTWYLGRLLHEGKIEHRVLRGESQWRASAQPNDQAGPEPAEGEPTP